MKNHALAFDATLDVPEAVAPEDDLSLAELVAQIQSSESYAEVSVREDAAEAIFAAMEQQGVTRAELARRLDKSRAYVTKILSGEENLSIESLSKIFRALDCQFRIEYSVSHAPSSVWAPPLKAKTSGFQWPDGWRPFELKTDTDAQSSSPETQGTRWKEEDLALC